jgi:hypothetical protein
MGVDLRRQTAEMLADAVGVQRRLIGLFLDEDEVAGLALIRKQIIGNAQGLLPRQAHQLAIERHDGFDMPGLDEVLGDDLQHHGSLST